MNWHVETEPAPAKDCLAAIDALECDDAGDQLAPAKAAARQLLEDGVVDDGADEMHYAAELAGSTAPQLTATVRVRQVTPPPPVAEPDAEVAEPEPVS